MKVVVYSTASAQGLLTWMKGAAQFPGLDKQWQKIRANFPDYEFTIVATAGASTHLVEYDENKKEIAPEGVKLITLPASADADTYVEAIRAQAPSIAIAVSYFGGVMDWETLKDALIAEELKKFGIRAVSNSLFAAETFFDKWTTHKVLTEKGFPVARATHIPSTYLKVTATDATVASNVYLDLAFHRIRQMTFPVIVKEASVSGSKGIFVAADFEKAKEDILSREDKFDLIIEEMLPGEQFGTEIHGTKGNYTILPPFKCTLNEDGVTDTKRYLKYGPMTDEKYKVEELRSMLRRLAEEMGIEGCAQVDLTFDGNQWGIIEVNPRMSGMTAATAALESRYPLEVVLESCLEGKINYDVPGIMEKCLYVRSIVMSADVLREMEKEVHVKFMDSATLDTGDSNITAIMVTIALGGFESFSEMAEEVKRLAGIYPGAFSDWIVESAGKIAAEEEL